MLAIRKKQPVKTGEVVTLTNDHITNKRIILSVAPVSVNLTEFLPDGGILQRFGIDYTISGNILSWDALGLDGFLIEGDRITINYFVK